MIEHFGYYVLYGFIAIAVFFLFVYINVLRDEVVVLISVLWPVLFIPALVFHWVNHRLRGGKWL